MKTLFQSCALILAIQFATTVAHAADAPQFRGPNRDGHFAETGLLKAWPEGGPALAWQTPGLGKGYSSMAVVNGVIYTAGMAEDQQGYIFALDLAGKLLWKAAYGPETLEKMATGARGTPTIDGDRLYIMSGVGAVYCLSTKDGKLIWQNDVATKYKAIEPQWVFSESLLVDGDLVFATPGGTDAAIVALNKMTGEPVWTTPGINEASAYCSPAIFTLGGRRALVQWLAETLMAVDPKTGEVLWTYKQKVPWAIHANTPVVSGNFLFNSAESVCGVIEVGKDGKSVTETWKGKDPEVLHHGTILHEGHLYGAGFRTNRKLYCLDFATGQEKWSTPEIGEASTIMADGMLYLYESPKKGLVHLVKPTPEKFERTGVLQVPDAKDKHWAHPVIADKKLLIRYDGTLYAYDIAAK